MWSRVRGIRYVVACGPIAFLLSVIKNSEDTRFWPNYSWVDRLHMTSSGGNVPHTKSLSPVHPKKAVTEHRET